MSFSDALSQIASMFAPRGRVTISLTPATVQAGTEITGNVEYAAGDQMRLVRALRVHLQMASTMLRVGTGHDGKPSMSPLTESRDLVEPLTLCTDLPVPAGRKYVAPFSLIVPEGQLLPTLPGQLDYHVVARAAVDGHAVGAWAQSTLVMLGGSATRSTLAPGDPCTATSPTGSRDAAMVVEVRDAVTLVQWLDGRLATWVRTADVERT